MSSDKLIALAAALWVAGRCAAAGRWLVGLFACFLKWVLLVALVIAAVLFIVYLFA